MEKYTLNQTPVRTARNFGINNIDLELDIPKVKEFDNAMIMSYEMDKIVVDNVGMGVELFSRIGLELNTNYTLNITVPEGIKLTKPVVINFDFDDDNSILIDSIKIIMEKDSKAEFILRYTGENEEKYFHYLKQETFAKDNSNLKVIIANMLSKQSDSFIAIENKIENSAKVDYILLETSGKTKISNYYAKMIGDFSENNLKTIYLGTDKDVIDINYNIEVYGKSNKCDIEVQGAIGGKSHKNFKGTIDFKQGCEKSKGVENENCMILSDEAKSKSLPMLLCKEENVEGEHGVSSGKIDESKLFYIMTKGISYEDSKKLIVKANFNKIIKRINDEELENKIIEQIDNNL